MAENELPGADSLLDAPGLACANLTPRIKEAIRDLDSGQVLEVRSDDPAAREGVPAWSRLTGNTLLAVQEDGEEHTRFYLEKK
ncbi:MAG: sulfurtransferase TusA family protein [Dehalococcoidia bacterium]